MAGFQLIIHGRFWVFTEGIPIDADHYRSEATLDCTYHR
jgi:hypothetical protein